MIHHHAKDSLTGIISILFQPIPVPLPHIGSSNHIGSQLNTTESKDAPEPPSGRPHRDHRPPPHLGFCDIIYLLSQLPAPTDSHLEVGQISQTKAATERSTCSSRSSVSSWRVSQSSCGLSTSGFIWCPSSNVGGEDQVFATCGTAAAARSGRQGRLWVWTSQYPNSQWGRIYKRRLTRLGKPWQSS